MQAWQEDFLNFSPSNAQTEHELLMHVERAAMALGFEYVAYGFQPSYPVNDPKTVLLNNYPKAWQERYAQADYLRVDPTVTQAYQSESPMLWSDRLFVSSPGLWEDAQDHGLAVGWAKSNWGSGGVGLLTFARSYEPLSRAELHLNEPKMVWLTEAAHPVLVQRVAEDLSALAESLTAREIEMLKWSADGKSAQDIASILVISMNTVNFHLKNAVKKLGVANKTAAVARAALLGLLSR